MVFRDRDELLISELTKLCKYLSLWKCTFGLIISCGLGVLFFVNILIIFNVWDSNPQPLRTLEQNITDGKVKSKQIIYIFCQTSFHLKKYNMLAPEHVLILLAHAVFKASENHIFECHTAVYWIKIKRCYVTKDNIKCIITFTYYIINSIV